MEKPLLIYKASAGSGKTTRIVTEYLKLTLPAPSRYQAILAITFTNKAAGEMKNRIINILTKLVNDGAVTDETGKYISEEVRKKMTEVEIISSAQQLLKNILHNYSAFAISTIDSLMHRIVRSFAFDLKLSSGFNVILDQDELVEQAVDLLLDNLGTDDKLTRFLVQFLRESMENNRSWHIENSLYGFAKLLQTEEARPFVRQLHDIDFDSFEKAQQTIIRFTKNFEKDLDALAKNGNQLMGDIPQSYFYRGKQGMANYFNRIHDKKYHEDGLGVLYGNRYVREFVDEGKLTKSTAPAEQRDVVEGVAPQLVDVYKQIANYADEYGEKYILYRLLQRRIHALAVLSEIERYLDQLKAEQDYVHISEFNHVIADEIWKNGSVPFIYERIGEKYLHCFIDEFQDTSVLQWHNLLPLVTNGLSSGRESMIVGDGKQSIYRFRSGEVEQFVALPGLLDSSSIPDGAMQEKMLNDSAQTEVLENNFRSAKAVVAFNNAFFEFIKQNSNTFIASIYDEHHQKARQDMQGRVTLDFVEGTGEALRDAHLDKVLAAVDECLSDGYRPQDIAVLCRKNRDGMAVARHLSEQRSYDVISSDSLLLSSSPELHFIAALLRYLHDPKDANASLEIFSYLFHHELWPAETPAFQEGYDDMVKRTGRQNEGARTRTGLLYLLGMETNLTQERTLYDTVEYIIRFFKLDAKPDPFITFFLSEIRALADDGKSNISDFLDWWEENKTRKSVVVPEGTEAIRIYTIHKAKGLEFPVVIHPFISKNYKETHDNAWFELGDDAPAGLNVVNLPINRQLEDTRFAEDYRKERDKSAMDEVNVTYVALTRPAERLYMVSEYPPKRRTKVTIPALLQDFLKQEGRWQVGVSQYVFGDEVDGREDDQPNRQDGSFYLRQFVSSDWRDKLVIAPEAPEVWDMEQPDRNVRWGNLIHKALANICAPGDIPQVTEQLLSSGMLAAEDEKEFKKTLKSVVAHDTLGAFFKTGVSVRNEAALVDNRGEILRPDKLIFDGRKVTLVEYKTGKPEKQHLKQIEKYTLALKEMGYDVPQRYLVYVDEQVEMKEV